MDNGSSGALQQAHPGGLVTRTRADGTTVGVRVGADGVLRPVERPRMRRSAAVGLVLMGALAASASAQTPPVHQFGSVDECLNAADYDPATCRQTWNGALRPGARADMSNPDCNPESGDTACGPDGADPDMTSGRATGGSGTAAAGAYRHAPFTGSATGGTAPGMEAVDAGHAAGVGAPHAATGESSTHGTGWRSLFSGFRAGRAGGGAGTFG